MGREALLESLRARAAEDRAALWRDAHAAADGYRAELAAVAAQERAKHAAALEALRRQLADETSAAVARRGRELGAKVAVTLGERCRRIAIEELPRLHDERGDELFTRLAAELPQLDWQRVEINPVDVERARARFPQAHITGNGAIHGGMDVEARDGRIRICNSLDTRLAMAWPDLLPKLLADLRPETGR